MLFRFYENLSKYLKPNRVLIIYGPRRVGKTTLLRNFLDNTKAKYRLDTGENVFVQEVLSSNNFKAILDYAKGYDIIAIDEAQEIANVGRSLKIIVDQIPNIKVIATGSSAFNLSQNIGEPLTGRKRTLKLFPLAQKELNHDLNKFDLKEKLSEFLIFGSYPDVYLAKTKKEKILLLNELVESYLLKDILAHEKLKAPNLLLNLLKLLAFQVGQLVSLNELATQLHVHITTIERYLDLLQKSFIIYKLTGFSKNLRNEIKNKCKYYFYDNGIRNGIISQYNDLSSRDDVGALFENFIFIERLKKQNFQDFYGQRYFWRTYLAEEIDLVESIDNKLSAFEMKYSSKKKKKAPNTWAVNYPKSSYKIINRENYLDFIG
jgi:predicted AAA+ superfamily ATPase